MGVIIRSRWVATVMCLAAFLVLFAPPPVFATHTDGAGHPLPHAKVKVWPTVGPLGFNPDDSVEDVKGLTMDVATAANPLTIATAWENTTCPGGPCGGMLWNPVTNDFECWGVTGGFTASVDLNLKAPVLTGFARMFQPGDLWVAGPNGAPLYVKFKGLPTLRIWFPPASVWAVRVDQATGDVWFSTPGDGSINRLNPATNVQTKWVVGGAVREVALDKSGRVYATAGPNKVVRLDPATNEVREWFFSTTVFAVFAPSGFSPTPDGIQVSDDGNVWFTESVSSKVGRLNPTTNVISEFTKSGLATPQLIATTGTGDKLQIFFTEGVGNAVSVVTQVEAVGTNTTVPPVVRTVSPTTFAITFSDRALSFRRVTITPATFDIPGLDGGPDALGVTKTAGPDGIAGTADDERIPGILRFPLASTGNSVPSGMTGVALANTIYGSFFSSSNVFEVKSGAIIAPPPAPKDTTPPVIVPTVSPAPNAAGWNNTTPVKVSWSVTDPESGIASSTGCGTTTLTAETGGTKLTCSATNGAGLTASAMVTVKIDTTPPKITGTLDPAANPAGWNKTDVKKTFTCTDNLSGVDKCPSPVTVTAEGETTVTVMATDVAGNVATDREVIKIDKTPPELTARCAPPSRSPFVAGRDDRSGVASVMLTGSAPLKVEEFKTAQTFRILDVAGNSLDATFGVKTQGSSEGREHETEFTLLSLSYNGKAPITPAENELECESSFEKSGALKEFEQKLELEDEGIQVQAKFEAKKNRTRITVKRQGIEQRFTRTGLVFILLTTNKGTLGFEFSP